MRTAILILTGSFLVQSRNVLGSPRGAVADKDSGVGISFLRRSRSTGLSTRSVLNLDVKARREMPMTPNLLRRARSDTDLIGLDRPNRIASQWSPPARVSEEEEEDLEGKELDLWVSDRVGGVWSEASTVVSEEELEVEYSGGGMGKGREGGGGSGGGGGEGGDQSDNRKIGDYYQEMLRVDPGNPLLLRNYGRFLHEVEGDLKGAEECYERAILASPGDGDVLSLYGNLVWETHRDVERAAAYFERAVEISPDDCYVLGSYAHFLWDAEEGDEEEGRVASSSPLVEAFSSDLISDDL